MPAVPTAPTNRVHAADLLDQLAADARVALERVALLN